MPRLPDDDEVVNLNLSKFTNKGREIVAGTISDLMSMTVAERAAVISYSLTESQQTILDAEIIRWQKERSDPNSAISRVISKEHEFSRPRYDEVTGVLYLKGVPTSFAQSFKARGLLSVVFGEALEDEVPFLLKDFLVEHEESLAKYDILTVAQLKSIKKYVNEHIPGGDLFVERGTLVINAKYL